MLTPPRDTGFAQVHDDTKELRREMAGLRSELRGEVDVLRRRFEDGLQMTLNAAILIAFVSFLVAHFA